MVLFPPRQFTTEYNLPILVHCACLGPEEVMGSDCISDLGINIKALDRKWLNMKLSGCPHIKLIRTPTTSTSWQLAQELVCERTWSTSNIYNQISWDYNLVISFLYVYLPTAPSTATTWKSLCKWALRYLLSRTVGSLILLYLTSVS